MLEALEGHSAPDSNLLRFDPALGPILDLAQGEELVAHIDGNRFQITAKGQELAREIENDLTTFVSERSFLETIGGKLTEKLVSQMI